MTSASDVGTVNGKVGLLTWTDDKGTKHVLVADAVISAKIEATADVTQFPIEDGSSISDHIAQKPSTISLELLQTESPIQETDGIKSSKVTLEIPKSAYKPGGLMALTSAIGDAVGGLLGAGAAKPTTVQVLRAGSDIERVNAFHVALLTAKRAGAILTVALRGRVYGGYAITKVSLSVDPAGKGAFSVDLVSLRTVKTANVKLPDPAKLQNKALAKKGDKPGQPPTDAEKKAAAGSVAHALLEAMSPGAQLVSQYFGSTSSSGLGGLP